MGEACSTNGGEEEVYRILARNPEGTRPLGRPRYTFVDNIKMDLREIGWDGMVWTGSIWLKIGTRGGCLNTVMNLRAP
jgi:hypothetical protein